jgi:hypothetical protein
MIDEEGKFVEDKRAKRIRNTKRAINRQTKLAKRSFGQWRTDQPHRYAKMHALNCGIPGCVMCANPRRIWGQKTIQEYKADLAGDIDGTIS